MVLVVGLAITSLAFAEMGAVEKAQVVNIKGTIIDNACGYGNEKDLANFIKTHTKECALMPGCVESGYSIYNEGKLIKFDKESNAKVEEFLRKTDSKLEVVIEAKKAGEELHLVSIHNQ